MKVKDLNIIGEVWATGLDVSVGVRFKKRSDVRGVGIWHLRKEKWAKQAVILDDDGAVIPDPKVKKIPPTWAKDPDKLVEKFIEKLVESTVVSEAQALLMVTLYMKSEGEEILAARQFRMDSNKLWLRAEASKLCAKANKDNLLSYEDPITKENIEKLLQLRQPSKQI